MNTDWLSMAPGGGQPRPIVERLLRLTWAAHREAAAANPALSRAVFESVFKGSGDSSKAACAAILSMGGLHAPIAAARRLLFHECPSTSKHGFGRVPGFGNSFHPHGDPAWLPLQVFLADAFPSVWSHIMAWGMFVRETRGKDTLVPNAAAFTAAVAHIVDWPEGHEWILAVEPRLAVWAQLAEAPESVLS